MGSKGGATTTTQNQTSNYAPTAQAAGYITNAMNKAQSAASNPFAIPQAPVAGFSQDQQQAFQQYRDAQGTAQPYYNQAASYFSPQGAQDFLNPYAANVMAGMQDVFGQQASRNTGQLTQAAGGVGADRIGVGQAELAKQQSLAAGQTLSGMYGQAAQQAQAAGQGQMALGQNAQNSAFQGANALIGTGGLQQQLSQAQMNSPYQQQLAQAAFPYQQAQFLAGITGSLAPGLGGTTTSQGTGTSTPPAPSMWSQLLGAGTAVAGGLGATGAFGEGGWMNGMGNAAYGGNGVWGGSSQNPLPGLDAGDYGEGFARGGDVNPYAEGGGVPTDPIDISQQSIIPTVQMQPMQAHIPQTNLNLNPPQQSGGSGGGGDALKMGMDVAKMAMMFINRGGRVNPYAQGGAINGYAEGGDTTMEDRFGPVKDALASGDFDTVGANNTAFEGPSARPQPRSMAMSFAGDPDNASLPDVIKTGSTARAVAADAPNASAASPAPETVSPYSQLAAAELGPPLKRDTGFAGSPWTALMSAGLGMMSGTSPYAGVNIGQGAMQGVKTLQAQRESAQKDETIDQASRRLAQEAKFHEDAYKRNTKYQDDTLRQQRELAEAENYQPAGSIKTKDGLHPAFYDKKSARVIDGITGKPPETSDTVIPKGVKTSPEEISSVVDGIKSGNQPPTLTGLYGDSVHVRAALEKDGFNLAKAQMEWKNAERLGASVNSSRMVSYVGLNKAVDSTIDEVKRLGADMKLSGVPFMNKLQLDAYINTRGNTPEGKLATRYRTAVGLLKEEFANLANGGYAPTEPAWKLANEQVNGNYGMEQLPASLDEIQRVIRYRLQNIPGLATLGPNSTNRYSGQGQPAQGAPPPAAGAKPPPGGGGGMKPSADGKGPMEALKRFNELIGGGKTEEEVWSDLNDEGYHQ